MAIEKIDTVGNFFVGQGDIIIFDKPADYATAALSDLANPKSLGDIHLDSTNFTGDDPILTPLRNEQGLAYSTTVENGTFGFEFFVPSTSKEMLQALMNAEIVTDTFAAGGAFAVGSTVTGAMHKSTVVEKPIMIVNETKNRAIVVPKAKIVSSLAMQDKVAGIMVRVNAENIDTDDLKTVMFVDGAIAYT
jgi:hypothetical protein